MSWLTLLGLTLAFVVVNELIAKRRRARLKRIEDSIEERRRTLVTEIADLSKTGFMEFRQANNAHFQARAEAIMQDMKAKGKTFTNDEVTSFLLWPTVCELYQAEHEGGRLWESDYEFAFPKPHEDCVWGLWHAGEMLWRTVHNDTQLSPTIKEQYTIEDLIALRNRVHSFLSGRGGSVLYDTCDIFDGYFTDLMLSYASEMEGLQKEWRHYVKGRDRLRGIIYDCYDWLSAEEFFSNLFSDHPNVGWVGHLYLMLFWVEGGGEVVGLKNLPTDSAKLLADKLADMKRISPTCPWAACTRTNVPLPPARRAIEYHHSLCNILADQSQSAPSLQQGRE